MFILIKNQEGESMNLLSQNTDFNALLAAMKTDIEAEYEKATGYAIDLDEDSGSDYEVGINVEDSAADGFCLASGYMYGADSNFDWGIFKVKSQKNNTAAKPYIGLDMETRPSTSASMKCRLAHWLCRRPTFRLPSFISMMNRGRMNWIGLHVPALRLVLLTMRAHTLSSVI